MRRMISRLNKRYLLPVMAAALACSTPDTPEPEEEIICLKPEPRDEPDVEVCEQAANYSATAIIGTGETEFRDYEPDEILYPIYGPQGGHHFLAGVAVTGLNPGVKVPGDPKGCPVSVYDAVYAEYSHSFPEDRVPTLVSPVLREMIGDPGEAVYVGEFIFIDLGALQAAYPEESEIEVQGSVVATDKCGTTVQDSRPFFLSLED
jgi:hypothetical protein